MTHEEWYMNCQHQAEALLTDSIDRYAAFILIEQASELKQGSREARHWFSHESTGTVSLTAVCQMLGLEVYDVQRRARYMLHKEKHERIS